MTILYNIIRVHISYRGKFHGVPFFAVSWISENSCYIYGSCITVQLYMYY